MLTENFKPGINNVLVNVEQYPTGENTENNITINLFFDLFGFDTLKTINNSANKKYHLYVFLINFKGGTNFKVLDTATHNIDAAETKDRLKLSSILSFPFGHSTSAENFSTNYYSIEIIYTEKELEDGSDLNMLISDYQNRLFSSKLDVRNRV